MESGGLPTTADFSPQVVEPACQPAHFGPSCPEDRKALRNWKRVLQDRAQVRAKVASVPDRPGLTWLLEQASLEKDLLWIHSCQVLSSGPSRPPGASHHWSRAVKLDRKVTTEGSWTGVPCRALPPMQLARRGCGKESDDTDLRCFPRSEGPRAGGASLEAPCRDPLSAPEAKQDSSCLASLQISDSHESAWGSVLQTVSTAPHTQAAVSTRPARTSATTSPGWRLVSSSVAARRTNPSWAPVCQSPGIAQLPTESRRRTPSRPA